MKTLIIGAALLVCPAYCQTPAVPAEFAGLYQTLEASIANFEQTIDAAGQGNWRSTAFSAELKSAHANLEARLLVPDHYSGVLTELDSLKALGVQAVSVTISYPILHPDFHVDPRVFQQYVDFYVRVASDVRARGLRLIVKSPMVFATSGYLAPRVQQLYSSQSLEEYMQGRTETAVSIALAVKPDYLSVISEPDTEAAQSGKAALGTVEGASRMLDAMLAGLQAAGVQNVAVGAGVGSWMPEYLEFVEAFASRGTDFIDVHVYPVNYDFLSRLLEMADLASSYGKPMGVTEAWLAKAGDSELKGGDASLLFWRDLPAFWAPLDGRFLETLVKFAHYKQLAFFSPFWSERFHAYVDYQDLQGLSLFEAAAKGQSLTTAAIIEGAYTPAAHAYRQAISEFPDTVPPTQPEQLLALTDPVGVTATWEPSQDNVGVAGYNVYRDNHLVATTARLFYQDRDLAPAESHDYRVEAYDAAGSVSISSPSVTGQAPAPPDSQPPNVPAGLSARALSKSRMLVAWTASEDNVTTLSYNVYRGTSPNALSRVATVYFPYFFDGGLASRTAYFYAVDAVDAAGNISAMSAPIAATTR